PGRVQAGHHRHVASGLRGIVTRAGPVVSWAYAFGSSPVVLMRYFLDACKNRVDIVTRHIYGLIYSWESSNETPYNLLNASFETAHSNAAQDRKSTRLNSSHVKSSYAVFCLQKKQTTHHSSPP